MLEELLNSPSAPACLPADAATQQALLEAAKVYIQQALYQGQVARAQQAVDLAWQLARHTGDAEQQALAHWCSALFYLNRAIRQSLAHYEQALRFYRQAQRVEEEGRLLIGYAGQMSLLGEFQAAEAAIQRAIACLATRPDYRDWPMVYINLAHIQGQAGRYTEMLASAHQGEALAQQFAQKVPDQAPYYQLLCAQAVVNQAYALIIQAHFLPAEARLLAAEQLAQRCHSPELVGRAKLNLGWLYSIQGRLFPALQLLQDARTAFMAAELDVEQAAVALEEAGLYERLTLVRQARQRAIQSMEWFAQAGFTSWAIEPQLIAIRLSLALREKQQAQQLLQRAQAAVASATPVQRAQMQGYHFHPLLQATTAQQQQALSELDQIAQALLALGAISAYLEMALLAAELATTLAHPDSTARYQQIIALARQQAFAAIERKAYCGLALLQPPALACQSLQQAVALVRQEGQQMPAEELKATLLTGHQAIYQALFAAQLADQQYGAATQTLLEAKGAIWAELTAPAVQFTPDPHWTQQKVLRNHWREELLAASDPTYSAICKAQLAQAEEQLIAHARRQERRRQPAAMPTLAEICQALPAQTVVLDYFCSPSDLWVCVFSPTLAPIWRCLGKLTELKRLLLRLRLLLASVQQAPTAEARHQMSQKQCTTLLPILQALYDFLIAPLALTPALQSRLLIIPDDFLFALPWSALYDGSAFLSDRYLLSVAPASVRIALTRQAERRPVQERGAAKVTILALGYAGNPPLQHIAAELQTVQQAFPAAQIIYPAAAKHLRWEEPPTILHIAAHGHVEQQAPLLSQLELSDGAYLFADILNLPMQGVALVTLSACETAMTPEQGHVVLALAGAFLCAGAGAVLASLWSVDDQATRDFMASFYNALQNGLPPAGALQTAQNALRQAGFAHPYYWAAFQLLG